MNITKENMVSIISRKTMVRKSTVELIINVFLNDIMQAVSAGQTVKVTDFGTFKPSLKRAKIGRNPRTNEAVPIPDRVRPSFKASETFNDYVERSEYANRIILASVPGKNKKKG